MEKKQLDWPHSYCFIYIDNKIIGYTNTNREAIDICKMDYKYQWDYNNRVKKRIYLYNTLPQLVFSNKKIFYLEK
tara:strand:+ start:692 stop:916 length:225 start_codon:yes stop_codon:yes gene_type:complete